MGVRAVRRRRLLRVNWPTMSDLLCPRCGRPTREQDLVESHWANEAVINQLRQDHPEWAAEQGACVACIQEALLLLLIQEGAATFYESVQSVWPLDASAAFGALPTPLRMRADPRYTGKGVTVAVLDSGFYPHPDLTEPVNRIRAWVNAGAEPIEGSWDGWQTPGLLATETEPRLWIIYQDSLPPGIYQYKFMIDGHRWLLDPSNRARVPDSAGGLNSVLTVP